jgi:PIN domain nuclease of toxin-antitoxin system
MKNYVVDTVALVGYLQNTLPASADKIFKMAEQNKCKLIIPEIVFSEFVYISLKGRLNSSNPKSLIMEVLISLGAAKHIEFISMDVESWEELLNLDLPELHDRMICSITLSNNADLITNDKEIRKRSCVNTIWD